VHEAAVVIAEDLDLDVARARQIALEEDPIVAEAASRLAPAAAFTSSGKPTELAAAGSVVPGSAGTPSSAASAFAASLSPMRAIASGEGPTHVRPEAITSAAKAALSERKP
jgi:hypothetical protein